MLDFLERGPLMDEAGGGDGGGGLAVADASSDFGGGGETGEGDSAAADDGVHDAEFVDPGTEIQVREQQVPAQIKAGEHAIQNGRWTGSGKAIIENVSQLGPSARKEVMQALLIRDYYHQQFPGGKKEVAQLRQLAEKSGGEQGIGELQSIAEQMREIDTMYDNADPNFIERITSDDQGKRNYSRLMIPALNKFDQVAPKQMRHYQMVGFMHLMDGWGLPTQFATQAAILKRAAQAYNAGQYELAAGFLSEILAGNDQIANTLSQVYTEAQSPRPALDDPKNPQIDDQTRKLTQDRQALQKEQWEFSVSTERKRLFNKSFSELTKGRTLTPQQDSDIKGWYEMRLNQLIKGWSNNSQRFLQSSDKDGYLKEQFAFFQKSIPEAMRYAVNRMVPAKPGPKSDGARPGAIKPPVPRGTSQNGAPAVRIAKMPPTSDLDAIKTTGEMLSANRAYTKDGRLVQWA